MANEIRFSGTLQVTNGNIAERYTWNFQADQANAEGPTPGFVTVGTSEESTTFPELTNEGWLYLKNLDDTNYVEFGFSTTVYGIRLLAGESACLRLKPGVTLYMLANTAACGVQIMCFGV